MLLASLLIASFVIFGALYLAPGNPISALSGGRALPPASLHVLEQRYHLNQPFFAQYWYWLENALHGNLGLAVEVGRRLVEDHDRRCLEQQPRDGEPLSLTAGQPVAAVSDHRLEPVGQ